MMATNAANQIGNAMAPAMPDPLQVKLAQVKQAVDAEGLTDPEQYLRMAASKLVEAGLYQQALAAQKQADTIAKSGADVALSKAQAHESVGKGDESHANAVESLAKVGKTQQEVAESKALQPYKVALEKMKVNMTDPASQKALAEASKATNEAGMVKGLALAHIEQLKSEAVKNSSLTEKERKQSNWELVGTLYDKKAAGTISKGEEGLLNTMVDALTKPQTVVNSIMGNAKTPDGFLNPGAAAVPPVPTPGGKPGGKLPSGLPAGSVPIGTAGGKPVYQTPDGRRLIVK